VSATEQAASRATAPLRNDNAMKLGIFAMNCSGGTTFTTVGENRIIPTWEQQAEIARRADAAGWEFLLPLARWRGFGGTTQQNARQFEVFTWAAGLAAQTSQIQVLATAHVPVFEPLVAAKQGATIDHISGGRFGLNVVAGWSDPEMAMFGKHNPEHDERYAIADEWITLVEQLWTQEEEIDFQGRYYRARGAYLAPRPLQQPRPVIVQAGSSPTGMDFAARHADFGFQVYPEIPALTEMNASLRKRAAARGREIGVLSTAYVVCADTEKEARRYLNWYVEEHGDFEAAGTVIEQLIGGASRSWPEDAYRAMARGVVAGWSGFPLVGTPDQITDQLVQLKAAGTDGVALSWLDYSGGIGQFVEQVIPLMVESGLRAA
jgi:alkanesulfonate monooxygenase SsuD/methylene tetrahydromethanopterin reductase-like flavin-dependent oxidoreductase (luciferase family)